MRDNCALKCDYGLFGILYLVADLEEIARRQAAQAAAVYSDDFIKIPKKNTALTEL